MGKTLSNWRQSLLKSLWTRLKQKIRTIQKASKNQMQQHPKAAESHAGSSSISHVATFACAAILTEIIGVHRLMVRSLMSQGFNLGNLRRTHVALAKIKDVAAPLILVEGRERTYVGIGTLATISG